MADHKSKADFNAMSVAELKKYLQERGISASGYLKTSLVEIASAVEKIGPQCVHVWLTKLSYFLVSGVSLGFYQKS